MFAKISSLFLISTIFNRIHYFKFGPAFSLSSKDRGCGISGNIFEVKKSSASTLHNKAHSAVRGMWPWMAKVSVKFVKQEPKDPRNPKGPKKDVLYVDVCGGALINEWWIITTARCLYKKEFYNVTVAAGDVSITMRSGRLGKMVGGVQHPSFKGNEAYDVRLLRVDKSFDFGRHTMVNSACLASANSRIDQYSECYYTGWDLVEGKSHRVEDILQEVPTKFMDKRDCQKIFPKLQNAPIFCGMNGQSDRKTSLIDSGGPLVCKKDGKYSICGVLSGHNNGKGVSLFTDLRSLNKWIISVIKKDN